MFATLLRPTASKGDSYYRDPLSNFWYGDTGTVSTSGETITTISALRSAAVYACVRVLSEAVASLPLKIYERLPEGGKRVARVPLSDIVGASPNSYQTAFEFWEIAMWNLLLRGNFLAEKVRDGATLDSLEFIHSSRIRDYKLSNGQMSYTIDQGDTLQQRDALHVRGPSHDGQWGMNPIETCRNAIGLSLAAERFGAGLFSRGVRPSGAMEVPGQLSPEAFARLRDSMQDYAGAANNAKTLILEEGAKWSQMSMTNEDAQFLETRKFQVNEIARIFRVPPHMIQDLERATFSNIEHMGIDFVVHALRPWLVRIEQSIRRDLILDGNHFAEFLVDGLLRGDTASRYTAYASALQNEWKSVNEIRESENLNPIEGGDVFRNPAINPQQSQPQPREETQATNTSNIVLSAWAGELSRRLAARECSWLETRAKHAASDPVRFAEACHEYYQAHAKFLDSAIEDYCQSAGVSEAARVEAVQAMAIGSYRELTRNADPQQLVTMWSQGALAKQHHATLLGLIQ